MENSMTDYKSKHRKKPPEISPYLFPLLLAGFGIWCCYDGWFTTDPDMLEHIWFNRSAAFVLLPWAIYDFLKVRKYEKAYKAKKEKEALENPPETE